MDQSTFQTDGLPLTKLLCVLRNLQAVHAIKNMTLEETRFFEDERVLAAWDILIHFRSHCAHSLVSSTNQLYTPVVSAAFRVTPEFAKGAFDCMAYVKS